MPNLVRDGSVLATFPTRADCIVEAFRLRLVYDYGRKRNSLLPGVKIEGEDHVNAAIVPTPGKKMREG